MPVELLDGVLEPEVAVNVPSCVELFEQEAIGRESAVASLGLVPIRRDRPGAVAGYMLERTEPIYRRSS